MDEVRIERTGGLAGFGASSHLKSRGRVRLADLSAGDRAAVEALFRRAGAGSDPGPSRDAFTYRLTRDGPHGEESVELPEGEVPAALAASVRDTLD